MKLSETKGMLHYWELSLYLPNKIIIYQIYLCNPESIRYKASTTLRLDLFPEFMGDVVGQASFLFHISQQFLPIFEGISFEK